MRHVTEPDFAEITRLLRPDTDPGNGRESGCTNRESLADRPSAVNSAVNADADELAYACEEALVALTARLRSPESPELLRLRVIREAVQSLTRAEIAYRAARAHVLALTADEVGR